MVGSWRAEVLRRAAALVATLGCGTLDIARHSDTANRMRTIGAALETFRTAIGDYPGESYVLWSNGVKGVPDTQLGNGQHPTATHSR